METATLRQRQVTSAAWRWVSRCIAENGTIETLRKRGGELAARKADILQQECSFVMDWLKKHRAADGSCTSRIERRLCFPTELRRGMAPTAATAVRAADTTGNRITGYGARYYDPAEPGTQYDLGGGIVERIAPGAFDSALRRNDDIVGLFNHDPSNVLGRTVSRTMRVSADSRGLRYEIDADGTSPLAATVLSALRRGDVRGSSFAFTVADERFELAAGDILVRWLLAFERLFDTGPVTYPAYEATSAGARSVVPKARPAKPRDAELTRWRERIRLHELCLALSRAAV